MRLRVGSLKDLDRLVQRAAFAVAATVYSRS